MPPPLYQQLLAAIKKSIFSPYWNKDILHKVEEKYSYATDQEIISAIRKINLMEKAISNKKQSTIQKKRKTFNLKKQEFLSKINERDSLHSLESLMTQSPNC